MINKNKHCGFTLSELLIVVAIVAVLVAICIPVFSQALEKAKAATCAANRRSIYAEMTEAYLEDEQVKLDEMFSGYRKQTLCPNGGSLSYVFNTESKKITVNCSIHNGSLGPDFFSAYTGKGLSVEPGKRIDSVKNSSLKTQIMTALSEAGIDVSAMGAKTWAVSNSAAPFSSKIKNAPDSSAVPSIGTQIIWSDISLSSLDALSSTTNPSNYKVRVMCYNADLGTYVVGYSNVMQDGSNYLISKSSENNGYGSDNSNKAEYFESYDDAYDKFLTLNQYALK